MGHVAERELLKKIYGEAFKKDVSAIIDGMTDAQVVIVYMRLRLQGKLKKKER